MSGMEEESRTINGVLLHIQTFSWFSVFFFFYIDFHLLLHESQVFFDLKLKDMYKTHSLSLRIELCKKKKKTFRQHFCVNGSFDVISVVKPGARVQNPMQSSILPKWTVMDSIKRSPPSLQPWGKKISILKESIQTVLETRSTFCYFIVKINIKVKSHINTNGSFVLHGWNVLLPQGQCCSLTPVLISPFYIRGQFDKFIMIGSNETNKQSYPTCSISTEVTVTFWPTSIGLWCFIRPGTNAVYFAVVGGMSTVCDQDVSAVHVNHAALVGAFRPAQGQADNTPVLD